VKTLLVHNPKAGSKRPTADELMGAARAAGLIPTYQSIKEKGRKAALQKKWDLVIAAGGDGTVAKIARNLKNRDTPLAILPIGTANNIARSLGISGEPEEILNRLSKAKTRLLDIGLAKGPWGRSNFLEAVGIGPVAEAISQSGPKPPRPIRVDIGREELRSVVHEAEPEPFGINVDGEIFVGEFLLIEIMNLGLTGPALPLAFSAAPDDQLLDVVFLFAKERSAMESWLTEHPEGMPPPLTVIRGRKIKLTWQHGHLRIDSQVYLPPKKPSPIEVKLSKRSLQVLIP
jgi:diacylglycerol kinase (ATP)